MCTKAMMSEINKTSELLILYVHCNQGFVCRCTAYSWEDYALVRLFEVYKKCCRLLRKNRPGFDRRSKEQQTCEFTFDKIYEILLNTFYVILLTLTSTKCCVQVYFERIISVIFYLMQDRVDFIKMLLEAELDSSKSELVHNGVTANGHGKDSNGNKGTSVESMPLTLFFSPFLVYWFCENSHHLCCFILQCCI